MDKRDFTILVADDDDIARDVISSLLAREGYPVRTARDGRGAIDALSGNDIRLVITDLRMPGADGIEVLKHAVKRNHEASVVILTAYGTLDTTLEAIDAGAYDYLTKPFKGQEIVLVTERAFERAALLEQNRMLRAQLRAVYLDGDFPSCVADRGDRSASARWTDHVNRLTALTVFTDDEARDIRGRLGERNG